MGEMKNPPKKGRGRKIQMKGTKESKVRGNGGKEYVYKVVIKISILYKNKRKNAKE